VTARGGQGRYGQASGAALRVSATLTAAL